MEEGSGIRRLLRLLSARRREKTLGKLTGRVRPALASRAQSGARTAPAPTGARGRAHHTRIASHANQGPTAADRRRERRNDRTAHMEDAKPAKPGRISKTPARKDDLMPETTIHASEGVPTAPRAVSVGMRPWVPNKDMKSARLVASHGHGQSRCAPMDGRRQ